MEQLFIRTTWPHPPGGGLLESGSLDESGHHEQRNKQDPGERPCPFPIENGIDPVWVTLTVEAKPKRGVVSRAELCG